MVKLMLDGFGGDRRQPNSAAPLPNSSDIECYHVNTQYSENLEDVGLFCWGKVLLVFYYCLEAIWCRFRYGIHAFYYVPAPGKRAALYRDWIVMLLCRPFFRRFIHHWHAVGLGDWLEHEGTWIERWATHQLLGRPDLGIALAIPSMRDALWFRSNRVKIVANGIPDPCPSFNEAVLPYREARFFARSKLLGGEELAPEERELGGGDPEVFRVLFLAHCTASKGVFDALDAVAIANQSLAASSSPVRIHLTVAGGFLKEAEQCSFDDRIRQADLAGAVTYAGFVSGEAKTRLLNRQDALCFPSFYEAESFGLVVVEGMAAGQTIVTTRWRAIPELLPADYQGLVPPRAPDQVAQALIAAMHRNDALLLRGYFLQNFTAEQHLASLAAALKSTIYSDPGQR